MEGWLGRDGLRNRNRLRPGLAVREAKPVSTPSAPDPDVPEKPLGNSNRRLRNRLRSGPPQTGAKSVSTPDRARRDEDQTSHSEVVQTRRVGRATHRHLEAKDGAGVV